MKSLKKVIFFATVISILIFSLKGRVSGVKFDSNLWKNCDMSAEENWTLRWDMMNDLRNNYALIGKNEQEITALLGNPREGYYLGYTGRGINTGSLRIIFNSKGIVVGVKVRLS